MALLRSIADAGSDIMNMALEGTGGAATILEAAEKKIYALRQGRNSAGLEPISKILLTVYDQMSMAAKSGKKFPECHPVLTIWTGRSWGINNSDLILIASRPGMGKTSFALNIAMHVAKTSGKTVVIFSLEMSREQLALRLLSSEAHR
jgi:replicative DNA helicase